MNKAAVERAKNRKLTAGAKAMGLLEALIGAGSDLIPAHQKSARQIIEEWHEAADALHAAIEAPEPKV